MAEDDCIYLKGICICGYRSFPCNAPQRLYPLSKINLIAGANNSGKSNILGFIQKFLTKSKRDSPDVFGDLDKPHGDTQFLPRLDISIDYRTFRAQLSTVGGDRQIENAIEDAYRAFTKSDDLEHPLWLRFLRADGAVKFDNADAYIALGEPMFSTAQSNSIHNVYHRLQGGGHSWGNNDSGGDRLLAQAAKDIPKSMPSVITIPAFRQIVPGGMENLTADGKGLIEHLARLESPNAGDDDDQEKFLAIEKFVQTVLDEPEVRISIPHGRNTILVKRGSGPRLPLAHQGSGIEQVVMLAAAATLHNNRLICMEEPEIHLNPLLQRKLLQYLNDETDNQYLIATHSAAMLDAEIGSIFHVRRVGDQSFVSHAFSPNDRYAICADLGYRASDIVQANAIIWVEGPSDRIYVNKWINQIDPDLVEGIDYSIMFYGGSLLKHLNAADSAVEEFIELRRLNRNIAIIIDSDKESSRGRINATKKRICDEIKEHGGIAFVTNGYTIENYVPPEVMAAAIKKVHPKAKFTAAEQWQNPLSEETGVKHPNKAEIAREVANIWDSETDWPFGLGKEVETLVKFIRAAN